MSTPASINAYAHSEALHERASRVLAGGVSTAFRLYERPVPLFMAEASGSKLVDVDGNEYVDYVCGFGPVILGHADEDVSSAVAQAAAGVQQVGGQHTGEVELAELLCQTVPAFELVRLGSSGSEAVHAAVRLARGVTGRPLVVKFAGHYHGWFDGIMAGTAHLPPTLPESAGQNPSALADLVLTDWNEIAALEALFDSVGDRIAAVIMEPFPCNQGCMFPAPGYLEAVRRITTAAGSLLIFDEVITGFRVGVGGVQEATGVTPDLAVVAKAMANGFPISAFGGRRDLMDFASDNRVLHAGTFNGGGISVAAALATIRRLKDSDGEIHARLERLGGRLMEGLERLGAEHGQRLFAQGPGPVFYTWFLDEGGVNSYRDHLRADSARYARFAELMLAEGVRLIPAGRWYLTAAHSDDDVDRTLQAAEAAFKRL